MISSFRDDPAHVADALGLSEPPARTGCRTSGCSALCPRGDCGRDSQGSVRSSSESTEKVSRCSSSEAGARVLSAGSLVQTLDLKTFDGARLLSFPPPSGS